jgi:hypothetical protein
VPPPLSPSRLGTCTRARPRARTRPAISKLDKAGLDQRPKRAPQQGAEVVVHGVHLHNHHLDVSKPREVLVDSSLPRSLPPLFGKKGGLSPPGTGRRAPRACRRKTHRTGHGGDTGRPGPQEPRYPLQPPARRGTNLVADDEFVEDVEGHHRHLVPRAQHQRHAPAVGRRALGLAAVELPLAGVAAGLDPDLGGARRAGGRGSGDLGAGGLGRAAPWRCVSNGTAGGRLAGAARGARPRGSVRGSERGPRPPPEPRTPHLPLEAREED